MKSIRPTKHFARRVVLLSLLGGLLATNLVFAMSFVLDREVSAAPPSNLLLPNNDETLVTGKNITCSLKVGTSTLYNLFQLAGIDDRGGTAGSQNGRWANYQATQYGPGGGYNNDYQAYFDGGDSTPINYITATGVTDNFDNNYACAHSLFFLQSPTNPTIFDGSLVTKDDNSTNCGVALSVPTFTAGATGSFTATLSNYWSNPASDCSNAPDGTNVSMSIALPSGVTAGDILGDPGETTTGTPTAEDSYVNYAWVDALTIIRYRDMPGPGATPLKDIVETYKLTPSKWYSGDSDNKLHFVMQAGSKLGERDKLLQSTRAVIDSSDKCIPHIDFTSVGDGDNSLNIDFGGGGSETTRVADLKKTIERGKYVGELHDFTVSGTGCTVKGDSGGESINIGSPGNYKIWFVYYPGAQQARSIYAEAGTGEQPYFAPIFGEIDAAKTTLKANPQPCALTTTTLTFGSSVTSVTEGSILSATWGLAPKCDGGGGSDAAVPISILVRVGDAGVTTVPVTSPPVTPEQAAETVPNCEDSIMDGFGWIVCPILHGIDNFIGFAENWIESQLKVNTSTFNNPELKQSWTAVARISSAILVMIALVMVISTAMGFGVFDAYTVKKVLPRLVIAAVGIWLSWLLVTTYISIMNDVGTGIADLMFSPFGGAHTPKVNYGDVNLSYLMGGAAHADAGSAWASFAITGGLIAIILSSGGIFAILAALVPVVAFIAMGFVILVLRQAVIVFLLVMAPLGIAAWILPNTEKIWKLWSGTLNKLLIMFPMFMGIFAAAKIFAVISADASTGSVLGILIPVLAYISPFIFLPALFKAAGGIFSNLTGMVNNKSKGLFDRGQNALKKRDDLSNRSLAKKQREQIRTQKRQTGFAAGMTTGALAGARRVRYGGLRDRAATRDKMQAAAIGLSAADEEKNLKDAGTLIDNDFRNYVAGGGAKSEQDWLKDTAASSTGAKQQAAIDRLVKTRGVKQLEELHPLINSTSEGQASWAKATRRNYSDLNTIAPQLARSSSGPLDFAGTLREASPEAMAGWSDTTWQHFGDTFSADPASQDKVKEIYGNDRLWGSMGDKSRAAAEAKFGTRTPSTGSPGGGGGGATPGTGATSPAAGAGTTSPAPGTVIPPTPAAPVTPWTPTPAPGASPPAPAAPPAARSFTRDQIRAMGETNVIGAVRSAGGMQAMHEGDLLSIANEHGSTAVGQAARDELRTRGVLGGGTGRTTPLP